MTTKRTKLGIMPHQKFAFALSSLTFITAIASASVVQAQTAVDLELGLLIDASGSISDDNFQLQLDAYQSIFSDPDFFSSFVEPGEIGQIAVGTFLFGGEIRQEIDWTLISNQDQATAFGNSFLDITRAENDPIRIFTDTDGAITAAADSILNNSFDGTQVTLDISTDGVPTDQSPTDPTLAILTPNADEVVKAASQNALDSGVDAINALGILGSGNIGSTLDRAFLANNVIGGTNTNGQSAFVLTTDGFDQFEATLNAKIQREIIDTTNPNNPKSTPEPSSIFSILALGSMFAFKAKPQLGQLLAKSSSQLK